MKFAITMIAAVFAMSSVSFANEATSSDNSVVVQKAKKKAKKAKGKKADKHAEGGAAPAPAEGAAH